MRDQYRDEFVEARGAERRRSDRATRQRRLPARRATSCGALTTTSRGAHRRSAGSTPAGRFGGHAVSVAGNRSVITPRDLEWLEWMGRWRFVTGPMIAREFSARGQSAPPTSVDRRLRVFIERGLVGYERVLADTPRLLWLTRAGMRLAELDGPVVTPKFADIRHDLKVI